MRVAILKQETSLHEFALTHRDGFVADYREARRDFDNALRESEAGAGSDPEELRLIHGQTSAVDRWQTLAESDIAQLRKAGRRVVFPQAVLRRERILDRFEAANEALQDVLRTERRRHLARAALISHSLIITIVLMFGTGYLLIEQRRRAERRRSEAAQEYGETQGDFTDAMQVTRSESEAYELLERHLERSIAGSDVVVLNRNNSDNRLEPATSLGDDSPLSEKLRSAEPSSCLAVRLARSHERGLGRESLLECEVCGALPGKSTCIPSLVGGEVIGSVLVRHEVPLKPDHKRRVQESVTQAAPVLANLRNLELAKIRAATDALTGLGNTRTVRETLKRMVAQAGRTITPMAVILIDLDHFKRINDTQGHGKGDEVLAAVGDVLSNEVRASDFVGRYGGEEFVAILPETDRPGAAEVAEKLRRAVSKISVPYLEQTVSASFGVAAYPVDAIDPEMLLRIADRALYVAKENGRNRVEVAASEVPDGASASSSASRA
jgi:diguanylate cyclase (GGDEF)-like protein